MNPKNKKWPDQHLDHDERKLNEAIERAPDPVPANPVILEKVRLALAEAARERRAAHGGARPGAGRPAKAGVRTMLRLSPKSRKALEALAEKRGRNLSETADEIFLEAARK